MSACHRSPSVDWIRGQSIGRHAFLFEDDAFPTCGFRTASNKIGLKDPIAFPTDLFRSYLVIPSVACVSVHICNSVTLV